MKFALKIEKNETELMYVLFCIISCILLFCLALMMNYDSFLKCTALIVIMHFVISYLFNVKVLKEKLISIKILFLIFIYIFNFGNLIVNLINENAQYKVYDFLHYYSQDSNIKAILFSFITINFMLLGSLIYSKKTNHKVKDRLLKTETINFKFESKENLVLLRLFSIIILIFTFPFELYISINKLLIAINQGYLATYDFYFPGILIQLSQFYIIGLILLAISFKESKKISNCIFALITIYQCFVMITGNRGMQTIALCLIILIYFLYFQKINFKSMVILISLGIMGIFAITSISQIRVQGYSSLSNFIVELLNVKNNPIIAAFDEFGFTLYTTSLSIAQVPYATPFTFGLTYLASFSNVLPNVSEFTRFLNDFSCFTVHLDGGSIGGSIIAELYYNFSYFGCILGLLIGYYSNFLSDIFISSLKNNEFYIFSFCIMPSISLMWWVRDSFQNIPRLFVYSFLFLFISSKIANFCYKKIRKETFL